MAGFVPQSQVVRVVEDGGAFCQQPLNADFGGGLLFSRFGHQVTELPGGRLLVTGGFVEQPGRGFITTNKAEVLPLHGPSEFPARTFVDGCSLPGSDGGGMAVDAGPPPADAGGPPPMCGAGVTSDGGVDGGGVTSDGGSVDGG